MLQELLVSPAKFAKAHKQSLKLKKAIDFQTAYIALAAPSHEDKTQSAFFFRSVKTIYAVMTKTCDQDIYRAFYNHSICLSDSANIDCSTLRKKQNVVADPINVSVTALFNDATTSFATLGFLAGIIEKTESWAPDADWMRKYANLEGFDFGTLTIPEFKAKVGHLLKNFYLFLDNFTAADECLLIRSLARICGLKCIVSNTNKRITNLVGPTGSSRDASR